MGYCYNLLVSLFILMWARGELVECQPPKVVNVGSVFTFNSVIGRAAKVGIEAAFDDINSDPRILTGIKLNPIMKDSSCSVFMGSVEAFQVLGQQVVAIIGPLSSSIAHMISLITNGLQVPLVSFGATDPTLSALQFPYFFRVALSDSYQMSAMADLIDYYEWHEVIVVYVDNEYGRNGISYLDDKLSEKMIRISYKVVLPDKVNPIVISDMLEKSKSIGPRVYVVHVNPDSGQKIFSVASRLQMMTQDYVWFATEWLAASLDLSLPMNLTTLRLLQGVIGLRQHVSDSDQKKASMLKKKKPLREDSVNSGLNNYGLYAYDTVWAVARAIDALLKENGNISFSFDKRLHSMKPSAMQLGNLKTFDNGSLLLEKLKQTNFTGLTGQVQFDSFRGRVDGAYDVINIDQEGMKIIGYWSNHSGLSVLPPEILNRDPKKPSRVNPTLKQAMWPGEKRDKPRGWVAATNERPLIIGIPNRASFVDFVTEDVKSHEITGYCIDVFKASLKLVPYDVPHRFVAFGNGKINPSYDELVRKVAADEYDAAVGDITIVTNRTKIADFTQPYAANGLVIVIPNKDNKSSAWVFLKPFTVEMWCVTAAFFVVIGVVIWILEHRINDDFRGPPKRQLITMFLFSFSTLFKTNQEDTVSTLGRMVMMVWLFLLMVITSSYTASLTSILTIQQLSSPITGIDSLVASNLPIGFQVGSFARSYLMENFNVPQSRLVSVENPADYARVLRLGPKKGGVGAIVDELPYVEVFLSNEKGFGIVGEMITKNGWGFVFKRGSPLAIDMSTAILKLSERGELQRIHKQWFCKKGCESQKRRTSNPNQLHLNSFWGLFLLCGTVTLTAFVIFLLNTIRQFVRYKKKQRDLLSQSTSVAQSSTRCAQVMYNFFNFIDEKEEAIKKMFKTCDHVQPDATR